MRGPKKAAPQTGPRLEREVAHRRRHVDRLAARRRRARELRLERAHGARRHGVVRREPRGVEERLQRGARAAPVGAAVSMVRVCVSMARGELPGVCARPAPFPTAPLLVAAAAPPLSPPSIAALPRRRRHCRRPVSRYNPLSPPPLSPREREAAAEHVGEDAWLRRVEHRAVRERAEVLDAHEARELGVFWFFMGRSLCLCLGGWVCAFCWRVALARACCVGDRVLALTRGDGALSLHARRPVAPPARRHTHSARAAPRIVMIGCVPQNHLNTLPWRAPISSHIAKRNMSCLVFASSAWPTSQRGASPGMWRSARRCGIAKPSITIWWQLVAQGCRPRRAITRRMCGKRRRGKGRFGLPGGAGGGGRARARAARCAALSTPKRRHAHTSLHNLRPPPAYRHNDILSPLSGRLRGRTPPAAAQRPRGAGRAASAFWLRLELPDDPIYVP